MKDISVVLGANYGDEGKGMAVQTINWTIRHRSLGIRFNGGGQAGHTAPSGGKRHVFRQYSAVAGHGSPTAVTSDFLLDLPLLETEARVLEETIDLHKMLAEPDTTLVTPYHIAANRLDSINLGHGSCGLGIHQTAKLKREGLDLTLGMLFESDSKRCLDNIEEFYRMNYDSDALDEQLTLLGYNNTTPEWLELVRTIAIKRIKQVNDVTEDYSYLVFEGAQGLGLDPEIGSFPYVTDSNTGLKNIEKYFAGNQIRVNFVTRPYLTRHGSGPMERETGVMSSVLDPTNVHNQYQGTMRTGPLDLIRMYDRIESAKDQIPRYAGMSYHVHLTCTNQIGMNIIPNYLYTQEGDKLWFGNTSGSALQEYLNKFLLSY